MLFAEIRINLGEKDRPDITPRQMAKILRRLASDIQVDDEWDMKLIPVYDSRSGLKCGQLYVAYETTKETSRVVIDPT